MSKYVFKKDDDEVRTYVLFLTKNVVIVIFMFHFCHFPIFLNIICVRVAMCETWGMDSEGIAT